MLRRPTVAALATYLRSATTPGTPGSDPADAPVRTSALVRLHGSGADPVTVLVHAGTGTIMPYRALITEIRRRSAGTGAVVGPGGAALAALPRGRTPRTDRTHLGRLRPVHPGPGARELHVVGYCLGGLIATEVARGLAEAGANVATLTVISSHSPRFRLDDELLSEYSFGVMMGIDPPDLGFPADELLVAARRRRGAGHQPGSDARRRLRRR